MKKFIGLCLLLASVNSFSEVKEKSHKVQCVTTTRMFEFLSGPENNESPILAGKHEGGMVIIWHNKEKRTITVTWTNPSGKETCLVLEGNDVKPIDIKQGKGV